MLPMISVAFVLFLAFFGIVFMAKRPRQKPLKVKSYCCSGKPNCGSNSKRC